jgi:hypothetical protein
MSSQTASDDLEVPRKLPIGGDGVARFPLLPFAAYRILIDQEAAEKSRLPRQSLLADLRPRTISSAAHAPRCECGRRSVGRAG